MSYRFNDRLFNTEYEKDCYIVEQYITADGSNSKDEIEKYIEKSSVIIDGVSGDIISSGDDALNYNVGTDIYCDWNVMVSKEAIIDVCERLSYV